jgi:hypothetical protein
VAIGAPSKGLIALCSLNKTVNNLSLFNIPRAGKLGPVKLTQSTLLISSQGSPPVHIGRFTAGAGGQVQQGLQEGVWVHPQDIS